MHMKDIYANASQVLIWIGEPDNLSGIAFDTLDDLLPTIVLEMEV
jgi:hypothetical protein